VSFGNKTDLKKRSTSSWLYPSFLRHLIICKHLLASISLVLTWSEYLQLFWKVTPKILTESSWLILLTIGKLVLCPLLFLKTSSWHFETLHDILLLCDQVRYSLTVSSETSRLFLKMLTCTVVSSAYLTKDVFGLSVITKSLMNILNKKGPLTLPWVVPLFPLRQLQVVLPKMSRCLRFSRKLRYQLHI